MTAFPPAPPSLFHLRPGLGPAHNRSPDPLEKLHKREIVSECARRGVPRRLQGAFAIHSRESALGIKRIAARASTFVRLEPTLNGFPIRFFFHRWSCRVRRAVFERSSFKFIRGVPERELFVGDVRVCEPRKEANERVEIFIINAGFVT